MPCTCCRKTERTVQVVELWIAYPICAQFNSIALVGCTERDMCDASTNVTIVFHNQKVRNGVVR